MKKLIILTLFSSIFLAACKKEEPNPHLRDPIYNDISAKEALVGGELASAQKGLEDAKLEVDSAKPLTGELRRAKKKYFEAEARVKKIKQEQMFLLLKKAEREREANESYRRAFKDGKDWPDPQEFESYKAAEALRSAPKTWDPKKRVSAEE